MESDRTTKMTLTARLCGTCGRSCCTCGTVPKTAGSTANGFFYGCSTVLRGGDHRMNVRGALDHFPGRDIIFGLRDPADRAVSHALWAQGFGVRNTSLSTALPSLKIPPLSPMGVRRSSLPTFLRPRSRVWCQYVNLHATCRCSTVAIAAGARGTPTLICARAKPCHLFTSPTTTRWLG